MYEDRGTDGHVTPGTPGAAAGGVAAGARVRYWSRTVVGRSDDLGRVTGTRVGITTVIPTHNAWPPQHIRSQRIHDALTMRALARGEPWGSLPAGAAAGPGELAVTLASWG